MQNKGQIGNRNEGFKNFIIGFLLGICVMLAIAAASSNEGGPGQYQCCAAGDDSLTVFVLDTETGHTWRLGRTDHYDLGTPHAPKSVRRSVTPFVD
ncbi:MAG: hypothetical protein ACETVZ_03615 [Phycisphaerae bacterium]